MTYITIGLRSKNLYFSLKSKTSLLNPLLGSWSHIWTRIRLLQKSIDFLSFLFYHLLCTLRTRLPNDNNVEQS